MSQFLTGRISHALGDTLVARGKEENRALPAAPSQVCSIVYDGDGQISQYKYQALLPLCRMSTLCGNLSITSSAIQLLAKVSYLPHLENCQYTTVYNCYFTLPCFIKTNPVMARAIPRLFSRAPLCCELRMTRRQTRDNSNDNMNRWFYSCRGCHHMVFDDWEGIRDGNPLCECEETSRGQVELGCLYVFRCARGECEYREELEEDEEDEEDD